MSDHYTVLTVIGKRALVKALYLHFKYEYDKDHIYSALHQYVLVLRPPLVEEIGPNAAARELCGRPGFMGHMLDHDLPPRPEKTPRAISRKLVPTKQEDKTIVQLRHDISKLHGRELCHNVYLLMGDRKDFTTRIIETAYDGYSKSIPPALPLQEKSDYRQAAQELLARPEFRRIINILRP